MQTCKKCESVRLIDIFGHCVDRFVAESRGKEYGPDYVPGDIGLGPGGDDVNFTYCLDCGQIQGNFPIHPEFCEDLEDEEEWTPT